MKIFPFRKALALLAVAIPAACALAQLPPQSSKWFWLHTPQVQIFSPEEGAVFDLNLDPAGEVEICAATSGFTNPIASVEFFGNTNSLGTVTNSALGDDIFCLTVSNLVAGDYQLTALATDTAGNSATSDVVDISVVTNLPPKVHLVAPQDGAVILGPTNIQLSAAAHDPDGTVAAVEFFAGDTSLGMVLAVLPDFVTNRLGAFKISQPYSLVWSNASLGTYALTAVAIDNDGASATSAPVNITVADDLPPEVQITSPTRGSTYTAPASVNISANVTDLYGTITSVQFFAGTTYLGEDTPVTITPDVAKASPKTESAYSFTWNNAPAGVYELTVVANNAAGLSSTTAPVKIKIFAPPPPSVIITAPWNHEVFSNAPVNISSFEWNFVNPVANVQFFASGASIGSTTNSPISSIVWSNALAGSYTLTAVATDTSSLSVTSAPVHIKVLSNPQPSGPSD